MVVYFTKEAHGAMVVGAWTPQEIGCFWCSIKIYLHIVVLHQTALGTPDVKYFKLFILFLFQAGVVFDEHGNANYVGDVDGQGFGLGMAPASAKPTHSAVASAKKRGRKSKDRSRLVCAVSEVVAT